VVRAHGGSDAGISYNVEIGGGSGGPVVAGSYNVVVDARHGSTVTVGRLERPEPVRRERISVLPRRNREPLGREADAAALAAAIAAGGLVQLCGPAGIGKSTLLRHLARSAGNGPDGVVFVSGTHKQVADLAQEVFEACYQTSGYAPSRSDLRGMLTGLRITVYVDDADLTIDELRELTDLVPDATFVLACRDSTVLGDGAVHHLDGLGADEASRLLRQALGRPLHDSERATALHLWRASGGNPLLLLRAAGIAGAGRSALPAPGAVGDLLPLLLDQLDDSALTALTLLAALQDAELSPEHIGALAREPDAATLCDRLTSLGLVTPGEHGYRCAPGVVPAVRRRDAEPIPVERLCRYFTRWAADPATTPVQVAGHSRAIERLAGLATNAGMPELTVALGRAAAPKLAHSLRFDAWGRTLGQGWDGARRAGDREAEAYFTHEEGIRCLVTSRRVAAAALLAQAVALWQLVGAQHGTDAASGAHQFLPQELQPPGTPPQITPGESDPSQAIADHMTELDATADLHDVEPEPFYDSVDSYGSVDLDAGCTGTDAADVVSAEVPYDPGPAHSLGNTTPVGDPGAAASAAGSAVPGSTAGAAAASGATAAATAAGGSLLSSLVGLVILGVVALVVHNSFQEDETGIAGDWRFGQEKLTIVKSGTGAYSFRTECDGEVHLRGNDKQATGRVPARDQSGGGCGPVLGHTTVTISVNADPDTARLTQTKPVGETDQWDCLTCGTRTLTRLK
jgi:energy-coupling factor transporter ATP-binding protein EcfA2